MQPSILNSAARIAALLVTIAFPPSCSAPPKRLNSAEAKNCRAEGGYESRAPFGSPICQVRYVDAGKSCSGKADCLGRCLFYFDGRSGVAKVGDRLTGECQAERSSFGCYGTVEAGKLFTDEVCYD